MPALLGAKYLALCHLLLALLAAPMRRHGWSQREVVKFSDLVQLPHPGPDPDTHVLFCWVNHSIFHHHHPDI